jgi:hypothetical protein
MAEEYKQDYKRTYTTFDNVAVDPTDEVWVPIYNTEQDMWVPVAMTAKRAEQKNQRFYFSDHDKCLDHCSDANDVEDE